MIEASDDADATQLWNQIGGATGISRYNALAGLTQATPNTQGFWGETLSSAADQIKVLEQLVKPSKLLSKQAVAYQLSLMTDIDPGENWGVTGGGTGCCAPLPTLASQAGSPAATYQRRGGC
jgi:hypothetical protein